MLFRSVQRVADELGSELNSEDIWQTFRNAYFLDAGDATFALVDYEESRASDGTRLFAGTIAVDGKTQNVSGRGKRSEEHTSELQSLMRISYAVFCSKKKKNYQNS